MKCPQCDNDNPSDSRYCGICGTPLSIPDTPREPATRTITTAPTKLKRGSVFAHRYEVIEELGKGGMGRVYRVSDKTLGQDIALKILKPEIADDKTTIQRFRNELLLTRLISHRNVCRIYDLSESEGVQFISMEYVSGENLKNSLRMMERLTLGKTIAIARQICEGLGEAHRLGVVHRDIKPQNIMIDREGNVRIMDFGIARSLKSEGITDRGIRIGTPEYMSPEQVEGKPADQRSDIYSLGIVLYELVSGKVPFSGDTPLSIALKHKTAIPEDPAVLNAEIPETFSRLVLKCLEKDPEHRFQTTEELLAAIMDVENEITTSERATSRRKTDVSRTGVRRPVWKKLGIPVFISIAALCAMFWFFFLKGKLLFAPENPVSIAVISFVNQTGDSSYDYLQDAIPNLLITSLEQSKYIHVTTWERMHDVLRQMGEERRSSIDQDLGFALCRREGIEALALGSIFKAGNTFATDVNVMNAATKAQIKSISTRGEGVESILRSQIDEISREIARGIGLTERKIAAGEVQITEVTTASMDAYNYFLRGREDYEKFYFTDAKRFLERAVELDPSFYMAYLYLAGVYQNLADNQKLSGVLDILKDVKDNIPGKDGLYIQAMFAARQHKDPEEYPLLLQEIIKQYPQEKRSHYELGRYYQKQGRIDKAIEEFQAALQLDPDFGFVLNHLAYVFGSRGDFERALSLLQRYAAVSPGDANPFDSLGEMYFLMGRLDEAVEKFKEALAVKPDFGAEWRIAYIYALKEDYGLALEWIDRYLENAPTPGLQTAGLIWEAFYHHLTGQSARSLELLDMAVEKALEIEDEALLFYALDKRVDFCIDWDKSSEFRASFNELVERIRIHIPEQLAAAEAAREMFEGYMSFRSGDLSSAFSRNERITTVMSHLPENGKKMLKDTFIVYRTEKKLAEGKGDEAIALAETRRKRKILFADNVNIMESIVPFLADLTARAYLAREETSRALEEYERLAAFDPAVNGHPLIHPMAHYKLAKLYEKTGRVEEARREYAKVLEIWKEADPDLTAVEDARARRNALN